MLKHVKINISLPNKRDGIWKMRQMFRSSDVQMFGSLDVQMFGCSDVISSDINWRYFDDSVVRENWRLWRKDREGSSDALWSIRYNKVHRMMSIPLHLYISTALFFHAVQLCYTAFYKGCMSYLELQWFILKMIIKIVFFMEQSLSDTGGSLLLTSCVILNERLHFKISVESK